MLYTTLRLMASPQATKCTLPLRNGIRYLNTQRGNFQDKSSLDRVFNTIDLIMGSCIYGCGLGALGGFYKGVTHDYGGGVTIEDRVFAISAYTFYYSFAGLFWPIVVAAKISEIVDQRRERHE